MYDLIILGSRYVFIFYIIFFILQSVRVFLGEEAENKERLNSSYYSQRLITILMHLTAFAILAYNNGEFSFKAEGVILCGAGLIFICVASWIWERVYKYSNKLLWNTVIFFVDISIIMLYRLNPSLAMRQVSWIGIGFLATLAIPIFLKIIKRPEKLRFLYIVLMCILILLPFFAGSEEYGSLNWITIGSKSFQPSEIVKFLFVFYLASKFKERVGLKDMLESAIVAAGIVGSMVYQKDLGGALIFFAVYFIVLYCATGRIFWILSGGVLLLGAGAAAFKLFYHVKVRIQTWINPWKDPSGGGYQVLQSLFAIASWGFLGSGLGRGMPGKIPVVERDFIFSAICEEFGAFFGICIIVLFATLFIMGIRIALKGDKHFNILLALGFTVLIGFQFFLIVGGVIKLIPLTGVTMPFISYGGTSVIVSLVIVGILQWVNGSAEKEVAEKELEIPEEMPLAIEFSGNERYPFDEYGNEIDIMLGRQREAGEFDETEKTH